MRKVLLALLVVALLGSVGMAKTMQEYVLTQVGYADQASAIFKSVDINDETSTQENGAKLLSLAQQAQDDFIQAALECHSEQDAKLLLYIAYSAIYLLLDGQGMQARDGEMLKAGGIVTRASTQYIQDLLKQEKTN